MLYQNFYPKWESYYRSQLSVNCSSELNLYHTLPSNSPAHNAACIDTALCMMDRTVKNVESQTASTGVLLGLLASILSILGSSPVELGLLTTSRPLLSLLLALAAPVINPLRLFEYVDPKSMLEGLQKSLKVKPTQQRVSPWLVVTVQFALAIAAVVNVTMVSYDLYSKAFSVVLACRHRYHIFLWSLGVPAALWVAGFVALMSRSEFQLVGRSHVVATRWVRLLEWASRWPGNEVTLCREQGRRHFHWNQENGWFFWVSQALALGTVGHIFYGTAVLSGYQFIAPSDALGIVARYVASAWVSRLILRSELAGMAAKIDL